MAKDFNQAIVLGNLTRDPELRYTPNGQAVTSFAVATNRSWTDASGDKKDAVEFHDIVVWGKLAEIVSQYLGKGRKVMIVGRLQTRNWEAQDGSKRSKTEIVATDVNFIDRPKDGAGNIPENIENAGAPREAKETVKKENKPTKKESGDKEEEIDIEDIPF